ncbi:exosome complex component RRP41-like protein [Dinothrombium tinctorium]|uniref:Putative exosome complex component RRP41 n=1 Tax=Dinothrombium tinctorium TaxID=1965070 RepID=A0A443QBE0_9ACAR|nr:exosome complex component RRP41-like protein [Dinothrombium tinctorium]
MARIELFSDEGFRCDGRRPHELRKMSCRLGTFEQADGSSYVEMGNTRVLATVYGPRETKSNRSRLLFDRAIINCEYSLATFSTPERRRKPRGDFRSIEITNNLKEVYESAILTELYPYSQIDIFLQVLQSDGSNYSACINAATLAIINAGIPIKDIVCACSAGIINDTPMVDLSYIEESMGSNAMLTVALLPKEKQILSMESSGRIHLEAMDSLVDTAINGCMDVNNIMKGTVLNYVME